MVLFSGEKWSGYAEEEDPLPVGDEGERGVRGVIIQDTVEGGTDWSIVNSGTGPSSETGRKGVKIQSEMERFLHVGIGR